jgi:hypothetical protein
MNNTHPAIAEQVFQNSEHVFDLGADFLELAVASGAGPLIVGVPVSLSPSRPTERLQPSPAAALLAGMAIAMLASGPLSSRESQEEDGETARRFV